MKKTNNRKPDYSFCLRSQSVGCGTGDAARCAGCGFNRAEAERRKRAPWAQDANGLWHKVIRREEGR